MAKGLTVYLNHSRYMYRTCRAGEYMKTELWIVTIRVCCILKILPLDKGRKGLENDFKVREDKYCTSKYITEEPDAVVPLVRICVGAVM
jgi:hypothetical protein